MGIISQFPYNNGYRSPEDSVFFENFGTGSAVTGTGTTSWTHASAGGSLCCAVAMFSLYYSKAPTSLTFTYGGLPMNYIGGVNYYVSTSVLFAGLAYLYGVNVPSGTQTVNANLTGGTIADFAINSFTYQNVGGFPTSPGNATASGNSTAATCSLGGVWPGCMVIGTISPNGNGLTGLNYPFVWNDSLFNSVVCNVPVTTTNPTAVLSGTLTAATYWGELLFSMAPPLNTQSLVGPKGQSLSTAIPRASTF